MKNQILLFIVALTMGALFSSCEKKEQSQLTLESIPGRATIKGIVVYDEGAKKQEGQNTVIMNNLVPSKGQTVQIEVAYSEYSPGDPGDPSIPGATGTKIFEVLTDESGMYSIDIPVGATPVTATIDVKSFSADHVKVHNLNLDTVKNVLYNQVTAMGVANLSVTLNDSDVEEVNILVKTLNDVESNALTMPATITGKISYTSEKLTGTAPGTLSADGKSSVPCKAVIKLYNMSNDGIDNYTSLDERVLSYQVDVDANGSYKLDAKFYNGWEYSQVYATIQVLEFYNSALSFTHYYKVATETNYSTQDVKGIYGAAEGHLNQLFPLLEGGELVLVINTQLEFTPVNIETIKGLGYAIDENAEAPIEFNDTMGWKPTIVTE